MEKMIESVGLTIHSVDGRMKEIPLEIWQVGVISQILGLIVRLPDWDDYEMSPKERVDERMEIYYNAIRDIASKKREEELSGSIFTEREKKEP